jgi:hypothetical protein
MANNRMYLRCPVCPDAKAVMLAKYFPSDGWTFRQSEATMDEFFALHHHVSQWGAGFTLEFEIVPDFDAPNQPTFIESPRLPFPKLPAP